jgi:hypothetical protein
MLTAQTTDCASFGLRARRPYIGFPLTRARRTRRMAWLAAHGSRQFPIGQWMSRGSLFFV